MRWRFESRPLRSGWRTGTVIAGLLVLATLLCAGALSAEPWVGQPVIGKNADGHLEVFRVEADGTLRHRWQKNSDRVWSSWCSLGGAFLPGIAVATNAHGQLMAFAVDRASRALWSSRQRTPNSDEWSPWISLGGTLQPPVTVAQDLDGRLEVFALAAGTQRLRHLAQTNAAGAWSSWSDLGGHLAPGLVANRNPDGRLELFGLEATTQTLVHCWQRQPNGTDWTDWSDLGGSLLPGFAVGRNARGRLEVFALSRTNHSVQRLRQASPGSSQRWLPWEPFGGDFQGSLVVGQNVGDRLEIFAVDRLQGILCHRWELLLDGSDAWSSWASLDLAVRPDPAVVLNQDGNLELFAVSPTNYAVIHHRRQNSRASGWLDWASLDQVTFPYSSHTWHVEDGLPHASVQALAQTPDGYLWVGTPAGLARFDGLAFTVFDATTTPELSHPSITALCADRQGALWIGTAGGGLVRLQNGVFSHFSSTNGLAGDCVQVIYEGKDGSLWLGTTTGLSRFFQGRFTRFTTRDGLSSDGVRALAEDRDGHLWIATGAGLNRWHGQTMDAFAMPNGLPNDSVRAICQDRGGRIWIGSNNGMLWYSTYWGNFYAYDLHYGLSDTFVSAICQDHENNLWVGTYSGLNRFREGRFFSELNDEGQPFDRVNALLEDREGNLWVGSREGLTRLAPKRFFAYTKRHDLTHNNVTSVLEDRSGALWLGTWGGGLNCLKNERVTALAATNSMSKNLILSLCESRDGSLWIGTDFDGGLMHLKAGRSTFYTWKDGLINGAIHALHEDAAGRLWIGTSHGLCRFQNGRFTRLTNQLPAQVIRAFCEDHAGQLWIGTDNGLSCWQGGRFTHFTTSDGLPAPAVTALYEDQAGQLWIGTATGGLGRYHQGRFRVYSSRHGLFSDEIFEILDDDHGWLWLTCSKGIFRVRKQELDALDQGKLERITSIAYGKEDGLESTQCNGAAKPAGWKSRDGRLWFPTTKGLVVVDPKTVPLNPLPPPVFIEQILADRKPVRAAALRNAPITASPAPPRPQEPLVLAPGRGELELRYTALNFQAPEATRFRYRLDNIDADWVEAGSRRTAYYNNLLPGNYRFRVAAANKDGVWNEPGAQLAFVLLPHFWQTWWWRGALGLLVLGGVGGSARYVTRRRFQLQLAAVEQRAAIEKERGRIAKDIHDDLGSSLTRILMLGERAEEGLDNRPETEVHLGKIVATARHTIQALDEIVWAINPENDSLEGLVQYISQYADEFFENSPVSCRLEIPVDLPPCPLPAEIRHDLFLVIKEAFNNTLKHAHASALSVHISATPTHISIQLQDNGRGFDPSQIGSGRRGNGLRNLRQRLEALGGHFALESGLGQGTRLTFAIPISRPNPV